MSERPFPPSPRRLALAHRAGLTAASPVLVGGLAMAAVAIAVVAARGLAGRLGDAIAAACDGRASALSADTATIAVLAIAAPVLAAAAAAAIAGHVVQTRAIWLPRRRVDGAPSVDTGPGARVRRTMLELVSAIAVAATVLGWLWLEAPHLAALASLDARTALPAAAALIASALAAFAIAYVALGALDALARQLALAHALAMTATEKREDERLAAADPRWAAERAALARPSLAGAAVLILGDDAAAAIAWDPRRRPVPTRVAVGRRANATQLLGLARRDGVPVHRDAALAAQLADALGPVPAAQWQALAPVIAALRR